MIEIELKAHLDDYEATRRAVEALGATLRGESLKSDVYYGPAKKSAGEIDVDVDPIFRLRGELEAVGSEATSRAHEAPRQGERWRVTAKRRKMADGVERNEEVEFGVDDAAAFREFAQRLGFRPFIVKRKQTRAYALGRASVELHRIEPIGDFIEIEVMLDDDADEAARREAEREVRGILVRAGVPEARIEPRLYIDLLRAAGAGTP